MPDPTPRRERLGEQWLSYWTAVKPDNAPPIQLQECRRAFYAGARALLSLEMTQLEDGTEPTDADLAMMDEVYAELLAFSEAIGEGRA